MTDKDGGNGWMYFLMVIVGILISGLIFNLTGNTSQISKEDIMVIEDKAYEQGYIRGYQDCQNGVHK